MELDIKDWIELDFFFHIQKELNLMLMS